MGIQIDRERFRPQVERFASKNKPLFKDNSMALSDDVFDLAQEFFDSGPWKGGNVSHYDTLAEARVSMKLWIIDRGVLKDRDKAWFLPSFVWIWIAQKVVSYIVKLVLEWHWSEFEQELAKES